VRGRGSEFPIREIIEIIGKRDILVRRGKSGGLEDEDR
jgi:hypothetical protein